MYCSGGSQVLFLIPLWPKPKTRARRQPEELTLLLIQLRRHQAKMAGVQSSSDAFTQLQQLQHNDLLGPSMQVRGSTPNLFYNPLQPFAPALWCPPPYPPPRPAFSILYHPVIHQDCVVCWHCTAVVFNQPSQHGLCCTLDCPDGLKKRQDFHSQSFIFIFYFF